MTDQQTYYHGTKADLKVGDLIAPGHASNYGQRKQGNFVYLRTWQDLHRRTTGSIEDDPNLTNQRFPGNPTKSYRSRNPFRVIGEVTQWQGHSPEQLKEMHDHLENLRQRGIEAIEE